MAGAIQILGLAELRAALKTVSSEAPKELARVNQQVGQIVVDEARARAPKGPHEGGGAIVPIANSIHASRSGTQVAISAGGPGTPHAVVEEFGGTIPRRGFGGVIRSHRRGGYARQLGRGNFTRIARRPYLFAAIAAKFAQVEDIYLGLVDALVEKFKA